MQAFNFSHNSEIIFGDVEQGRRILLVHDDYIKGLSRFDLQSKMQTESEVSIEQFVHFQSQQVIQFPCEKLQIFETIIHQLSSVIGNLSKINLPSKIYVNCTTGLEEADAAYCRGIDGIFLPQSFLNGPLPKIRKTFVHELWHIVSRNISTELRNEIYNVIGFIAFDKVFCFPQSLVHRKISNPDAVFLEHYIPITINNNQEQCLVPIIYGSHDDYKLSLGKFFYCLKLQYIVVEKNEKGEWTEVIDSLRNQLKRYFNLSNELFHLIDNFSILILKDIDSSIYIVSPDKIAQLESILL
eukprot:TRINITY_DN1144_c0_g1_i1.p1 TRINITY_DN1144_c0_g1~~TRINITY_DN1144_c0_g1_i1.p1  ORF type:complete len:310 (-),score=86.88 TRINITY_DN1144_c0_g1_i1:75-968(-)